MGIEIWKDIKNYEGKYIISNYGDIKSLNYKRTNISQLLKPQEDKNGYFTIPLCKNGKAKRYKVHKLVAQTFIYNPHNYTQINHKDENKQNNKIDNLEWCTQSYNNLYGNHLKKIRKKIICLDTGKTYKSIKEASEELSIDNSSICACCKGKLKTAGRYHWKYI